MSSENKYREKLAAYLSELRQSKTYEARIKVAKDLRFYIETESRSKSSDSFASFMNDVNRIIMDLVSSPDAGDKMSGVLVLNELIEVPYEENETKIMRFAHYLRMILSNEAAHLSLLQAAARAFGHLVRTGGTLATDVVVGEIRRALEALRAEKDERWVSALLVLKELAENASTLFSTYLDSCLDSLAHTLRDPRDAVREAALGALEQCLILIQRRHQYAQKEQLHRRIHAFVSELFSANTADATHAALRCVELLLVHAPDHILAHYGEVTQAVLRQKDHRDRVVRDAVIALLPQLVSHAPPATGTASSLGSEVSGLVIAHLIATLGKATHDSTLCAAYTALGELAVAVGTALLPRLDVIAALLKDGLKDPQKKAAHPRALLCVGMLARALGPAILPHASDLVDLMFAGGLSPALVEVLSELATHVPVLLPCIQARLLAAIALILTRTDHAESVSGSGKAFWSLLQLGAQATGASLLASLGLAENEPSASEPENGVNALLCLALRTLGSFSFDGHNLLPFVFDHVLVYLSKDDPAVRREAAICCLRVVLRPPKDPLAIHTRAHESLHAQIAALHDQVQLQQQLLLAATASVARNAPPTPSPDLMSITALPLPRAPAASMGGDRAQPLKLASFARASVAEPVAETTPLFSRPSFNAFAPSVPQRTDSDSPPPPPPRGPRLSIPNLPGLPPSANGETRTPRALVLLAERLRKGTTADKDARMEVMTAPEDRLGLLKQLLDTQLQAIMQLHVQVTIQAQLQEAVPVTADGPSIQAFLHQVAADAGPMQRQLQLLQLQVQQQQQLVMQAEVGSTQLGLSLNDRIFSHLAQPSPLTQAYAATGLTSLSTSSAHRLRAPKLKYLGSIAQCAYDAHGQALPPLVHEGTDEWSDKVERDDGVVSCPRGWVAMREQVIERLVATTATDPDTALRGAVLRQLVPEFDPHLSQPHHLQALFHVLGDAQVANRKRAMTILCRLTARSPAFVLPSLRQFMIELLAQLQLSGSARARVASAELLAHMASHAPMLLRAYAAPVLGVLTNALPGAEAEVAAAVLTCIADVAMLGGKGAFSYVSPLVPMVIAAITYHAARTHSPTFPPTPRGEADSRLWSAVVVCPTHVLMDALRRICTATGWVVAPYIAFPALQGALVHLVTNGTAPVRSAAAELIGVLGALDPAITRLLGIGSRPALSRAGKLAAVPASEATLACLADDALIEDELARETRADALIDTDAQEGAGNLAYAGAFGGPRSGQERALAMSGGAAVTIHAMSTLPGSGAKLTADVPAAVLDYLREQSQRAQAQLSTGDKPMRSSASEAVTPGLGLSGDTHYRNVAVQALTEILWDAQATHNHKKAVDALMFIAKGLGTQAHTLLPQVVPALLHALRNYDEVLRPTLLEQLCALIVLAGEQYQPFATQTFRYVVECWAAVESLPKHFLALIQLLAALLQDDFELVLPELVPRMLSLLEADVSAERTLAQHILCALETFGAALGAYLHMVLPALVRLWAAENTETPLFTRCLALHTTGQLLRALSCPDQAASLVLPLLHLVEAADALTLQASAGKTPVGKTPVPDSKGKSSGPLLLEEVLQTLCVVAVQLGHRYSQFLLVTLRVINDKQAAPLGRLQQLCSLILDQTPLTLGDMPPPLACWEDLPIENPLQWLEDNAESTSGARGTVSAPVSAVQQRLAVAQEALVKAWDTSQRVSPDDWTEWLRNVAVQLLKESPCPPLRACSALAQKDNVLARKLLPVAFASCWAELRDAYQDAVILALDTALKSPTAPSDVVAALLGLIDFMEHDDKPLPLDIRLLASLAATKCHSYAKALHYKELEFHTSSEPVALLEDLVAMHNKLQQPQAAIGVLRMAHSKQNLSAGVQERWFEQLHHWDDALAAYERTQLTEGCQAASSSMVIVEDASVGAGRERFSARGSIAGSILGSVYARPAPALAPAASGTAVLTSSGAVRVNGVAVETILGRLRCLKAMSEHERVAQLAIGLWNQLQQLAIDAAADASIASAPAPTSTSPAGPPGTPALAPLRASLASEHRSTLSMPLAPVAPLFSIPPALLAEVASMAAGALHMLGRWAELPPLLSALAPDTLDAPFYRALYSVHSNDLDAAERFAVEAREMVEKELCAVLGEGYARAYHSLVGMQLLAELDEVIWYKRLSGHTLPVTDSAEAATLLARTASSVLTPVPLPRMPALGLAAGTNTAGQTVGSPAAMSPAYAQESLSWADALASAQQRAVIRSCWWARLRAVQRSPTIWRHLLAVQSLVLSPAQNTRPWLRYAEMLRQQGRLNGSLRIVESLLGRDPHAAPDSWRTYQAVLRCAMAKATGTEADEDTVERAGAWTGEDVLYVPSAQVVLASARARVLAGRDGQPCAAVSTTGLASYNVALSLPSATGDALGDVAVHTLCHAFRAPGEPAGAFAQPLAAALGTGAGPVHAASLGLGMGALGFDAPLDKYPDMAVALVAVSPVSLALRAVPRLRVGDDGELAQTELQEAAMSSLPSPPAHEDENTPVLQGAITSPRAPKPFMTFPCVQDDPRVAAGYAQHLWQAGYREEALDRLHYVTSTLEFLLAPTHAHHREHHDEEEYPPDEFAAHPHTHTLYVRHHRLCPHFTHLAGAVDDASALPPPPPVPSAAGNRHVHHDMPSLLSSAFEPMVCMLTACPPPHALAYAHKHTYAHQRWRPLAPLRPAQRQRLRSLAGKLCQLLADWSLALLADRAPTLGLSIHSHTPTHEDAASDAPLPELRVARDAGVSLALSATLAAYRRAALHSPQRYRAWHGLAVLHFRSAQLLRQAKQAVRTAVDSHRGVLISMDTPTPTPTTPAPAQAAVMPSLVSRRTSQVFLAAAINAVSSPAQATSQHTREHHRAQYRALSGELYLLKAQLHLHVIAAIRAFGRAIPLARDSSESLQDLLRLLALWFEHGALRHLPPPPGLAHLAHATKHLATLSGANVSLPGAGGPSSSALLPSVREVLAHCFQALDITTWVSVTPQIIARLHSEAAAGPVRALIHDLLVLVGRVHPQALVYPLTVAAKAAQHKPSTVVDHHLLAALAIRPGATSTADADYDDGVEANSLEAQLLASSGRGNTAVSVMRSLRTHSAALVEQALMVSAELIRVAVLWEETWHEALEEASRLWFGQQDGIGMLAVLLPLHQQLAQAYAQPRARHASLGYSNPAAAAQTPREVLFVHMFARDLSEAYAWCLRYLRRRAAQLVAMPAQQTGPHVHTDADVSYRNKAYNKLHTANRGIQLERAQSSVPDTVPVITSTPANIEFVRGHASDLNQAWEVYCHVFRALNKLITSQPDQNVTTGNAKTQSARSGVYLHLHQVSPRLLAARNLSLAVPGTYEPHRPASECICIAYAEPELRIIESKQRPRKLGLGGSDGAQHPFLLKGHEDLRQDTRVMQLFELVNALLAGSPDAASHAATDALSGGAGDVAPTASAGSGAGSANSEADVAIRGYSVIPLSPISGLIQWLGNCDTLHVLIKDYREARHVLLNVEHRLMLSLSPDFQLLTVPQKMHVFAHAMRNTSGRDLADVLWLKAHTAETWLDRRGTYTRSLAVMSMVGYVLGLGDRHPCNLMLERNSGQVIHIDFGDCFEVAMHRDKFPEKVPFRLTRMLVRAMEVSGIEGTFRLTCERVMRTMRENKESVMAVLEAFIYDPLITWRLLTEGERQTDEEGAAAEMSVGETDADADLSDIHAAADAVDGTAPVIATATAATATGAVVVDEFELFRVTDVQEQSSALLNAKALAVIRRVEAKLLGRDFDPTYAANKPPQTGPELRAENRVRGFAVQGDSVNGDSDQVLEVDDQVGRLLSEATAVINLCQCYIGWCGFW